MTHIIKDAVRAEVSAKAFADFSQEARAENPGASDEELFARWDTMEHAERQRYEHHATARARPLPARSSLD